MKNTISLTPLLLAVLLSVSSYAVTFTVSNTPSTTVSQHNSIQSAVNAASSGDTILVNGSSGGYGGFTINNKRLTIIGPGWSPDKAPSNPAVVYGMTITGQGSNNTEIQGLYFSGSEIYINNNKPDSIRFIRNRFVATRFYLNQGSTAYQNYLFQGNYFDGYVCCYWYDNLVFYGTNSSSYQNFIFQNNVFFFPSPNYYGDGGYFKDMNSGYNTILFDHNIWYGPASGGVATAFSNCAYMTFSNNIFYRRNVNVSNSAFNNNLTFECATANNTIWSINGNVDAGGNIANTDPLFASQAAISAGNNNPLHDFSIATGAANNAGTDGKDLGVIYDAVGSLNWTNSRNSRLPRVYQMTITTTVVPSGGSINVNVSGKKSN